MAQKYKHAIQLEQYQLSWATDSIIGSYCI